MVRPALAIILLCSMHRWDDKIYSIFLFLHTHYVSQPLDIRRIISSMIPKAHSDPGIVRPKKVLAHPTHQNTIHGKMHIKSIPPSGEKSNYGGPSILPMYRRQMVDAAVNTSVCGSANAGISSSPLRSRFISTLKAPLEWVARRRWNPSEMCYRRIQIIYCSMLAIGAFVSAYIAIQSLSK